jgi:septal ring factor EnvC (AmiA/AmiB activator)
LVILLTLASLFLCGAVVFYVSTADNYRDKAEDLQSSLRTAQANAEQAKDQLRESKDEFQRTEDKLEQQIASLKTQASELRNQLDTAQRENNELRQKINNWTTVVESHSETIDKQGKLFQQTAEELKQVRSQLEEQEKELKETTQALVEKMAVIESLENEKKRLLEQKSDLQARLDSLLRGEGREVAEPRPVTPEIGPVQPRPAREPEEVSRRIGLEGRVTAVDFKNSMASLSIGKADGVREGMRFHITRGDQFICDLLIIDLEPEKAVGVLELIQQQPQVGDRAATNL